MTLPKLIARTIERRAATYIARGNDTETATRQATADAEEVLRQVKQQKRLQPYLRDFVNAFRRIDRLHGGMKLAPVAPVEMARGMSAEERRRGERESKRSRVVRVASSKK